MRNFILILFFLCLQYVKAIHKALVVFVFMILIDLISLFIKQSEVDFTMKSFLTSLINGKKVEVRFDAFKDAMYIRFNDNYFEYLLPSKNNIFILLGGKEPWLAYDSKWYRLLFKDKKILPI